MKVWKSLFFIFILSLSIAPCFAKTPKEIYRDYGNSVLLVVSEEQNGAISTGTAFAIDGEGTFITAAHVIKNVKKSVLIDKNKKAFPIKKTLWDDDDIDIAVIKVSGIEDLSPVPLKTYRSAEIGENLTIISYPKASQIAGKIGLESTLSQGLLSSIRLNFVSESGSDESNPSYDEDNPTIYNSEEFYNGLRESCEIEKDEMRDRGYVLMTCKDGRGLMLDEDKNVLYDNYDLVINRKNEVHFFANKNKKSETVHSIGSMLQYTTPISAGSSGGPIFNESGEVIAIVNSYLSSEDVQNMNFGRPVDYLPNEYLRLNQIALRKDNSPVNSHLAVLPSNKSIDFCTGKTASKKGGLQVLQCFNGSSVSIDEEGNITENSLDVFLKTGESKDASIKVKASSI